MTTFAMARSFEGTSKLNTDDLLTAIRQTCNYEGDLYIDGSLVMSCLGLTREDNTRRLLKYGITSYVNKTTKNWAYRYTDPAKGASRYYVDMIPYEWEGKMTIDFRIHDYRSRKEDLEFPSLGKVFEAIRRHLAQFTFETVHVSIWDSLLGYQSVKQEDWSVEGEPAIYQLCKDGIPQDFGFNHGIQEKLARNVKYGWEGEWTVKPYSPAEQDGKQLGDVVLTDLDPSLGFYPGKLFLIDGIEDGVYTLRDLDDYDVNFVASVEDILSPANNKQLL